MGKPLLTTEILKESIINWVEEYIKEGFAPSAYEINNGLCLDFAESLFKRLEKDYDVKGLDILTNDNFRMGRDGDEEGDEIWDRTLLESSWSITPTHNRNWNDLDVIQFGHHAWLTFQGKHYDSECPEGVNNFFDLPLFKHYITQATILRFDNITARQCAIYFYESYTNSIRPFHKVEMREHGDSIYIEDMLTTGNPLTDAEGEVTFQGFSIVFTQEENNIQVYYDFGKNTGKPKVYHCKEMFRKIFSYI